MRAVVQRVARGSVSVEGSTVAVIGPGIVVLLGVGRDDGPEDAAYLSGKIANLRIFEDDGGKLNRSLLDVKGSALVVSQFTLYGDCRQGRRPGFSDAAPAGPGKELYELFVSGLAGLGVNVATGVFQARMLVEIVNDGPVTLLLDSKKRF
ncbi:MAG: D-tyrosyl-tRNA(Tyr) deacylase [Peptococcaceae bacterium]|nr:D-tyrosyl-tRNA(Tyr) deacylase [Peptococcaceae bacterium]